MVLSSDKMIFQIVNNVKLIGKENINKLKDIVTQISLKISQLVVPSCGKRILSKKILSICSKLGMVRSSPA